MVKQKVECGENVKFVLQNLFQKHSAVGFDAT